MGSDLEKGAPLVIGIAYWPGADMTRWRLEDQNRFLNPCFSDDAQILAQEDGQVAVFNTEIDSLQVLRTSLYASDQLQKSIGTGDTNLVTAVVFSGEYSSEPRVIRSLDSNYTKVTGVATSMAVVVSLDRGEIRNILWHDLNCRDCLDGQDCMEDPFGHAACVDPINDCRLCASGGECPFNITGEDEDRCDLGLHVAFSGDDANGVPLDSSLTLIRITQYDLQEIYESSRETVTNITQEAKSAVEEGIDSIPFIGGDEENASAPAPAPTAADAAPTPASMPTEAVAPPPPSQLPPPLSSPPPPLPPPATTNVTAESISPAVSLGQPPPPTVVPASGCQVPNNGVCTQCFEGWYLNATKLCEECSEGCATCEGGSDSGNSSCSSCQQGYYMQDQGCAACNTVCTNGCYSATDCITTP